LGFFILKRSKPVKIIAQEKRKYHEVGLLYRKARLSGFSCFSETKILFLGKHSDNSFLFPLLINGRSEFATKQ